MAIDIKSMTIEEIKELLCQWGEPGFRAGQIFRWLQTGATKFDEMTDLSKSLRAKLERECYIATATIHRKLVSQLDGTVKYVFRLHDGELIESVLMSYHHGYTVCISTQVGCRMGCTFCASGQNGLFRSLTASEMLAQIQTAASDNGIRVSNVVMMGMGEPLDNFDNSVRFLRLVSHDNGLNIGLRHISLSTSGVVPGIRRLAQVNLPITLSISLHAPNNAIRSTTMPINRKWPIEELLQACREYQEVTTRRISFEYALIAGVNDSDACAKELADLLKGLLCHVNLIPANPVVETKFVKPDFKRVRHFEEKMNQYGIPTTVRRTLGADIDASCGQLRRKTMMEKDGDLFATVRSDR